MSYKTTNPALSDKTFRDFTPSTTPMTLEGTATKAAGLLALTFAAAAFSWIFGISLGICMISVLVAFVVALAVIFNPRSAPWLSPVYAVLEGVALGGVSAIYEAQYPGIVTNAVGLTFGVFATMLFLYRTRMIQATENFKLGVLSATGAVALLYIVDLGLMFFGIRVPFIHEGGFWGIAFSLLVVGLAALNLVMDFDFIETGVERQAPKYMEWYSAFGLLVTLVWLYLELLRLLSKMKK
ncbi:MAG: Bax inhibitor-1/YccA family protein [Candidatus Melainabacteria bacterium]|nr:Bax inhibitor-1/YccA family protein [Candidatus Melainabacteria bacterium]